MDEHHYQSDASTHGAEEFVDRTLVRRQAIEWVSVVLAGSRTKPHGRRRRAIQEVFSANRCPPGQCRI